MFLKILAIAGIITLCTAAVLGVMGMLVNLYKASHKMFYSILCLLILFGWMVWSVIYLENIP